MKKLTMGLVALLAMASTAQAAFDHSEMCSAGAASLSAKIEYSSVTKVDGALSEAAARINALAEEPVAFVVNVTAGTAVRVGQTSTDVGQDAAAYIQKIVTYAASTPACAASANQLADGVNCFIQLPNKVITLTFSTAADLASDIVVGVFSVGSGVLKSAEQLSQAIAEQLQNQHNPISDVLSVPFVIVGAVLHAANVVIEVILVDTIGGTLNVLKDVIGNLGMDLCDLVSSLLYLQIGDALGAILQTATDVGSGALDLIGNLISLGGNIFKP